MRVYLAIHRIIDGTINAGSLTAFNGQVCTTCNPLTHAVQWVPSNYAQSVLLQGFLRTDVISFDTFEHARDWAALPASLASMVGALVVPFQPDEAVSAYMLIVHTWQLPAPPAPNGNCSRCPPSFALVARWVLGSGSTPLVIADPTGSYVVQFANEAGANSWLAGGTGSAFVDGTVVAGLSIP